MKKNNIFYVKFTWKSVLILFYRYFSNLSLRFKRETIQFFQVLNSQFLKKKKIFHHSSVPSNEKKKELRKKYWYKNEICIFNISQI